MTIVGFNFTSIIAEKKDIIRGKVNINNNVAIKDVAEKDLSLGDSKQKALRFEFEFTSKYDPSIGGITLLGEVLFIDEVKKTKEILAGWKKSKALPKEVMTNILNTVLGKCNIEALILSEHVNLPPPLQLPRVRVGEEATQ